MWYKQQQQQQQQQQDRLLWLCHGGGRVKEAVESGKYKPRVTVQQQLQLHKQLQQLTYLQQQQQSGPGQTLCFAQQLQQQQLRFFRNCSNQALQLVMACLVWTCMAMRAGAAATANG
jgi:hypothetical protein